MNENQKKEDSENVRAKTAHETVVRSTIAAVFTIFGAVLYGFVTTDPVKTLKFENTAGLSVTTIPISKSSLSDLELQINARGVAIYAGKLPQVLVQVGTQSRELFKISDSTASLAGSEGAWIEENGICETKSEPAPREREEAVLLSTYLSCNIPLEKLEGNATEVLLTFYLRGNVTNKGGTPHIGALATYQIKGNWLYNISRRILGS